MSNQTKSLSAIQKEVHVFELNSPERIEIFENVSIEIALEKANKEGLKNRYDSSILSVRGRYAAARV